MVEKFGKELAVSARRIRQYENEGYIPPDATLDRLAHVLDVPAGFLSGGPIGVPREESFSFRAGSRLTAKSRDVATATAVAAVDVARWLNHNFELPEPNIPELDHVEPDTAAAVVRSTWGLGEQPLPNLIHLLEAHGVRVFRLADEIAHMDAFSFWADGQPFVMLSGHKSPERSRWDAAHELAHLALHRHGGGRDREAEADRFAGDFLLPPAGVRARGVRYVDLGHVRREKLRWKVSAMAMIRAYHRLDFLTDWQYRSLSIEATQAGLRKNEGDIERETSQLIPKVVEALEEEGVSLDDLADEIDLRPNDLRGMVFAALRPVAVNNDSALVRTPAVRPVLRLVGTDDD